MKTKDKMWAGPLEAMILAKILNIRIQIYPKQKLRRTGAKGVYSVRDEDAVVDVGDMRRVPMKLVSYGFSPKDGLTGCHYNAVF